MNEPKLLKKNILVKHPPAGQILKEIDEKNSYTTIPVTVYCKARIKVRAKEYLKGNVLKEYENGDILLRFHAVKGEHFWFGTLLSLGDEARVIEPSSVKEEVIRVAEKILDVYHKL